MWIEWVTQLSGMFDSFIALTPKLVGALILLVIGIILGRIFKNLVKKFITRYKLEERLFEEKLIFRLSSILPFVVAWSIYLVFIRAAVDFLAIVALTTAFTAVINWILKLIGVFVIVFVGYLIAQYAKRQIEKSKLAYSTLVGNVLFFLIVYVAIVIALPLIGITPTLLNNILLILVGSVGVGLAIAVGLGLKDTVAEMAKKYRKKKK